MTGNKLLDRLPADVMERIGPELRRVHIERGQVLHLPGEPIAFLYLPITCVISITVTMANGSCAGTAVVGSREVVGINAFMGGRVTTGTQYVAQISGEAWMIAAAPFRAEFDRNTQLRDVMLTFTQAKIAQISQNAACCELHSVSLRSARWLLEIRDRVQSDAFFLSQESFAAMIGASRITVSRVMLALKEKQIITYSRGNLKIIDPAALAARSCECYLVLKEEYDHLLTGS